MPTGKVKWYDAERGFGFLASDDGDEVFLHASALPEGTETIKPGTKVDFGIADGRKGKQALAVKVLGPSHSVTAAQRKPAEDMVGIIEDLMRVLEGMSGQLRRGRYPDRQSTSRVAGALRKVADDLEG